MNTTSPLTRIAKRTLQAQCPHFRSFASTATPRETTSEMVPRWRQTPKAMAQPIRTRPQSPAFPVNTDGSRLDEVYVSLLGKGGDKQLSEEVKWVAVTHKSFDHGRQGNNDRLAYLGKRIVDLQTSLALLQMPLAEGISSASKAHPALKGLENVTAFAKQQVLDKNRIAQIARGYGLAGVMRWKPKKAENLKGSGVDTVLAHTIYSVIGALSLQRGSTVATQIVREKILAPLGLRR